MTEIKAVTEWTYDEGRQEQQYDAFDRFGRRIGASVKTGSTTLRAAPEATWYQLVDESRDGEVRYFYKPHALRDGKSYGALQREQSFATPAERDAAVVKYFLQAQKRAAKASVSQGA